ncbi:MAG TPA: trypsin-like serine protease [Bacteroidales bacterium]|nr:trypsin-like serine protease [Bacteroidales bacterium]
MKKNFLTAVFLLVTAVIFAQKVPVHVVIDSSADRRWQLLDEDYRIVFNSNEYFTDDTISFSLESNKRYYFYCTIDYKPEQPVDLYNVILDEEPLLLIRSDETEGDHFFHFFTGTRSYATKITGGTDALISDFPWQVYLTAGNYSCGGSIISPEWILTAAHCVFSDAGTVFSPSQVRVKAGANNPYNSDEGQVYQASQVITHEGYSDATLENDIALIKLANPINISQAKPVTIVTETDVSEGATDPGIMTWVTGWGLTSINPEVSPTKLQKVQLPIISNATASTVWRSIPSTVLMAGYKNGNKDACNGDSGGPLVVPVFGEYRLAGIVSWGSDQCNTYGAYTRVSLFDSWIRSKTGIQSLYRPPVPAGDSLICQGRTSSAYTVASVSGISGYEWRLDPQNAGNVTGTSNNATVSWNTSYLGSVKLIYRVVLNGNYSDWSQLDIKVVLNTRLLKESNDTAICADKPITLSVTAEGYNLVYNWYRNGNLFRTGTDNKYSLTAAQPENSGVYAVSVTGQCGTVRSGDIDLIVYPLTKVNSISPDASIPFGSDHEIEVQAGGHNLSYQWQKDSVILQNATDPVYIIENANATNIGNYLVTVKGTCGTERSDSIYLFVEGSAKAGGPDILLWPSVTTSTFNIAISSDDAYNIKIYNSSGLLISTLSGLRYRNEVDLTPYSGGIYYITVYNSTFRKTLKVIRL